MKRFSGKVRLFCVSNIMVSFVGTGFLGINGYSKNYEGPVQSAHEISLTSSDTEPVSQFWEGEEYKLAFISNNVEAVIAHQENTCPTIQEGENNNYALITNGIKAVIDQHVETIKKVGTINNVESKTNKTQKTTKTTTKTTTQKATKKTTSVVAKKEVSKSTTYKPASYSSVTGDAIVNYAKRYMGLRYKTGTPSLSSGADCSGFTMLIYREFGVSLPRTVSGQTGKGVYVSKSNLQKGDLVFYKAKGAKGGATHVGIYIGGGQVIHESRPGVGVKISTVNMMQYVTARRVINSTAKKIAEQKKVEEQNKKLADTTSTTATPTSTPNNINENNVSNNVETNKIVSPTVEPTITPTATPVIKEESIIVESTPEVKPSPTIDNTTSLVIESTTEEKDNSKTEKKTETKVETKDVVKEESNQTETKVEQTTEVTE